MTTKYTEIPETMASEPFDGTADELAPNDSRPPIGIDSHQVAQRSFGQVWGLHPGITLLILVVDTMLFGANAATLGALFPVSLAAACVLGFITYRAQMRWYGDDAENARIKAVILAFLTAIPTPLPAFLYVPAGVVGLVHLVRRKS